MLEPAAKEVFIKYRNALLAIGVDFCDELVTEAIEDCNQNLESRLQSVIAYYCWLQTQNTDVVDPNNLFLQAFNEGWNPIGWQDEFLEREEFKSPAQKWWDKAKNVDVLKNIVVDVQSNFWSGGKIIFAYPSGQLFTLDLSRAMDMSWSSIIEYYERVTGVKIQQHPNRIILQKPSINQP